MPSSQPASSRGDYSHIPIPTYEEATLSRPSSSQGGGSSSSFLGPSEISNDAERQGLLNHGGSSSHDASSSFRGYRAPTVESARNSFDSDVVDNLPSDDGGGGGGGDDSRSARESMEELRREMSEMEYDDGSVGGGGRGSGGSRNKWSARGFASALNLRMNWRWRRGVRLPPAVRQALPSWQSVRAAVPRPPSAEFLRHIKLDFSVVIRVVALIIVLGTGYIIFFSDVFRVKGKAAHQYQPQMLQRFLRDKISEGRIRTDVYSISRLDHVAGTEGSYVLGHNIKDWFERDGLNDVHVDEYEVFLNYPKADGRKIAILEPEDKQATLDLEERPIYPEFDGSDVSSGHVGQFPVMHGHSKSGSATGPLVYANYGSPGDYKKLKDMGVEVKGSIVMVRHGGSEPGAAAKVKVAESNGAVGVIMYSDPNDQDKDRPAFNGQWRADDAVERGTVSNAAMVLGDVLSPGFASKPDEKKRISQQQAEELGYLPGIPSLPISWPNAEKLFNSLEGVGKDLRKDAPDFVGGIPYVQWWSGGEGSPKVLLQNENEDTERQPIYNVFGRIDGIEQPAAKIIVGNHRDAWCFGAMDPGSGTAIMLEVARSLAELTNAGWNPARTIEFASWDAGEFNMMGSTEHVEANVDELRERGVAYINVGIGAFGPDFWASASPSMERALLRTLELVEDERQNATLKMLWDERQSVLGTLGSGSDFVAFQDIAGVASVDMGFKGSSMPYRSCHDTFQMVDETFDPGFHYHKVMATTLALLVLELADAPIVPIDARPYAEAMAGYVDELTAYAKAAPDDNASLDLAPLHDAVGIMRVAATEFYHWEEDWAQMLRMANGFETVVTAAQRADHNDRAANFERGLLDLADGGGIPGREQFKHVVFSPRALGTGSGGGDNNNGAARFAGITDAIDARDFERAQAQINLAARLIEEASRKLQAVS